MNNYAFHILRAGLAITFLWVGILILQNPDAWTGFIGPRVESLLIGSPRETMVLTAVFDLVVGFFLLIDVFTFLASVLASFHLVIVLAVAGIDATTVRDIGLLAGALALVLHTWPTKYLFFGRK